nr:FAD-linked oxidase C-terminal domain-containing protein [Brachybacterium fresconis]
MAELLTELESIGRRHGVRTSAVAHAGDGNLHPSFSLPGVPEDPSGQLPPAILAAADDLVRTALDLGGTISGELRLAQSILPGRRAGGRLRPHPGSAAARFPSHGPATPSSAPRPPLLGKPGIPPRETSIGGTIRTWRTRTPPSPRPCLPPAPFSSTASSPR